jgi:hypothetical protein
MSNIGDQHGQPEEENKPPRRYWYATESFFNLKFSNVAEIFLGCALLVVGATQAFIYWRQAGIMKTQANIAIRQNEITIESTRAIVYAKEIRVEKKDGAIPGEPGKFEPYWWFSAILENGGGTSTEHMGVSAQASVDPSRPEIMAKLPFGMALGAKQEGIVTRISEAGPENPEKLLLKSEELEQQNKPSRLIRTILGPHVSQAIGGFGLPIEETKRRVREGEILFIHGAIHYNDRFSKKVRLTKYCFVIGFEITAPGELQPATSPCPHWNCADEECEADSAAFDRETVGWRPGAVFVIGPEPAPPSK